MEAYCKQMLRVVVAQICQKVGWQAIKEFPLELLSDVLDRFLKEFTRELSRYVEFCGRTEPNLEDVALVVDEMSINLHELFEFVKNVDPVPCVVEPPKLPVPKPNSLNILRPGDAEMIQRPSHFHEHLPSINIVTNGADKVKIESEDTEHTLETSTTPSTSSNFKVPALFPKEESLNQRVEDNDSKGVSFGNSSVQLDKNGQIRISGISGKTASAKPPVFNTPPPKPVKLEPTPPVLDVKPTPSLVEKNLPTEKPQTPPLPKKMPPLAPLEGPLPPIPSASSTSTSVPKPLDVLALKKDKKEKKRKKLLQMQEKQQRKQMKLMKKMAMEKNVLFDKPHSLFEKQNTLLEKSHSFFDKPSPIIPPSSLPLPVPDKVEDKVPKTPEIPKIPEIPQPKPLPELPSYETKSISITPVKPEIQQKITSEPDKNKLNIFKKIPVKKDVLPTPTPIPSIPIVDVDASPMENFNLPYGTTITPAPPLDPVPIEKIKDISPSKPKEIPGHFGNIKDQHNPKIKEPFFMKNKDSPGGKTKESGKSKDVGGKSKEFHLPNDSMKKDDVMSIAKAMMSAIGGSKASNLDEPPPIKAKKRKPKQLDRSMEDIPKLFNEPLNLSSAFLPPPKQQPKIQQDPNIIDLSVDPVPPPPSLSSPSKPEKPLVSSNFHQPDPQEITAINKKLMKMDTVMKPTFQPILGSQMQHSFLPPKFNNIFNFPSLGSDLPPAFQNIHVPMFGFGVPPIIPNQPVVVPNPVNVNTAPLKHVPATPPPVPKPPPPVELSEPIDLLSSDESTRGGEDMEIEPPTVQETPPKEDSPDKSPDPRSPSSPDKKKKGHKKHKKNKSKGNDEKLEKIKKKKRKNKDEDQSEGQKDKKKKDKKKDKKDKKVRSEDDSSLPSTSTAPTSDLKSDLFGSPMHLPSEPMKVSETESPIPKLTLKLGGNVGSSVEKQDLEDRRSEDRIEARVEGNSSPELAKISALITHAPKQKPIENVMKSPSASSRLTPNIIGGVPFLESFKSPLNVLTPSTSAAGESSSSMFLSPKSEKNIPVPSVSANIQKLPVPTLVTPPAPVPVESNRPSSYIDEEGNEVWICPACGRVDDGTPMIGCDGCDAWYHWICVGIKEPPNKNDDWFCRVCILKNREEQFNFPPGERKKKSKKSKKSSRNVD